jgi:hypothetical protein
VLGAPEERALNPHADTRNPPHEEILARDAMQSRLELQ